MALPGLVGGPAGPTVIQKGESVRVLVVDDEAGIRQVVSRALAAHGIAVDAADGASAALASLGRATYDLVVLDVAMPGVRDDELLQAVLAAVPGQRVMMLSAIGDVRTKVYFLDRGAVEYLPKPFALPEFVARVRVHARADGVRMRPARVAHAGPRLPEPRPVPAPLDDGQHERWVRSGSAALDVESRRLHAGDQIIQLSQRECLVLAELMRRPAQVCRRDEVLRAVWGDTGAHSGNVVDVYIGRLRAKLPTGTIRTIRSAGYAFAPP